MKVVKKNGSTRLTAESFDEREFIDMLIRYMGPDHGRAIFARKISPNDPTLRRDDEAHSIIIILP